MSSATIERNLMAMPPQPNIKDKTPSLRSRKVSWKETSEPSYEEERRNSLLLVNFPGNSHKEFKTFNNELEQFSPEISRVLKLCFSSLVIVFCDLDVKATKKQMEEETTDIARAKLVYASMEAIPVGAVTLFWEELLGINRNSHEGSQGDQDDDDSDENWIQFISAEDRDKFLEAVRLYGSDNDCIQFIVERLTMIGFLTVDSFAATDDEIGSIFEENIRSRFLKSSVMAGTQRRFSPSSSVAENDDDTLCSFADDRSVSGDEPVPGRISYSSTASAFKTLGTERKLISNMHNSEINGKRFQYFRITDDLKRQYAFHLSLMPRDTGGFANPFLDAGIVWNEIMVEACFKKRKKIDESTSEFCPNKLSVHKQKSNHFFCDAMEHEQYFWVSRNPTDVEKAHMLNDNVLYVLQMLPTHLVRARRLDDAIAILCSPTFIYGRMEILGITEATQQLLRDCEELRLQVKGQGCLNIKNMMISAFTAMKHSLSSEYPISEETEGIEGERCEGEIGKALHRLAFTLFIKSWKNEALQFYVDALHYKSASLGPYHMSVAHTCRSIGRIYLSRRMFTQGLNSYEKALRIEKTQTEKHPLKVAETLRCIAIVHSMMGDYYKAIMYLEEALILQKDRLGDSMEVSETYDRMGKIYSLKGHYDNAINCAKESLRIKYDIVGEDSYYVAKTHSYLGKAHRELKDYDKAMDSYQLALRLRKKYLGDTHEEVGDSFSCIADVHVAMENYKDAVSCYETALQIRKSIYGEHHEKIVPILYDLGLALDNAGDSGKAIDVLGQAARIIKLKFGPHHSELSVVLHKLGIAFLKKGDYANAVKRIECALKIGKGSGVNVDVVDIQRDLGDSFFMMGSLEEALVQYKEALDARVNTNGKNDLVSASICHNMGVTYLKKRELTKATECFVDALSVRKMKLGENNVKVADTLHNFGLLHLEKQNYKLALDYFTEALKIRKSKPDESQSKVADTEYYIMIIQKRSGLTGVLNQGLYWSKDLLGMYKHSKSDLFGIR